MNKKYFEPGDTIISARTIVESLMVLSPKANKHTLLPVLFKNRSFLIHASKLIESIILHDHLFTVYNDENRVDILSQSKTSNLEGLIFSIPKQFIKPLIMRKIESLSLNDYFQQYSRPSLLHRVASANNIPRSFSVPDLNTLRMIMEEDCEHALNKSPVEMLASEDEETLLLLKSIFQVDELDLRIAPINLMYDFDKGLYSYPHEISDTELVDENSLKLLDEIVQNKLMLDEKSLSSALGISYTSIYDKQEFTDGFSTYKQNALLLTAKELTQQVDLINDWLKTNFFSISTPLIFDYVVHKAKANDDLLKVTLDVRNSKEATAFRNQCVFFEKALQAKDKKQISEMILEVDNTMKIFAKNLCTPLVKLDISYPFAITANLHELKEFAKFKKSRHLVFLSRLYKSALESNHTMDKFVRLLK